MIKSVSFSSDFDLAAVKAEYEDQISAESADKAVVLSRGKRQVRRGNHKLITKLK